MISSLSSLISWPLIFLLFLKPFCIARVALIWVCLAYFFIYLFFTYLILSPSLAVCLPVFYLRCGDNLFSVCIRISVSLRTSFPFHPQSPLNISLSLSFSVLCSFLRSLFIFISLSHFKTSRALTSDYLHC